MFYGHEMQEVAVWDNYEAAAYTAKLMKYPMHGIVLPVKGGYRIIVIDHELSIEHDNIATKGFVQALMARHDFSTDAVQRDGTIWDGLPFFRELPKERSQ